MKNQAY